MTLAQNDYSPAAEQPIYQDQAPFVADPSILHEPRGQAPLGSLEGLQKSIPYQEGFIGDLWQLGYIPQKLSSLYPTLVFLILSFLFFVLLRNRVRDRIQLIIFFLFSLFVLGPIRLALPFGISSLYGVVRFGGLVLAFFLLLRSWKTAFPLLLSSPLLVPLLLYTATLLLSFLHVLDASSYMSFLNLAVTGYLFFLIGFLALERRADLRIFSTFFAVSGGVAAIMMFIAFGFKGIYQNILKALYPLEGYLKLLFDLQRGRLTPIWDIEFLGQFLLYRIFSGYRSSRIAAVFVFALLCFVVLLSNTRYRVILLLFSLAAFVVLFKKTQLLKQFFIPSILFIFLYLGISNLFLEVNVFDRFLLRDFVADRLPLSIRAEMAKESLAMAAAFPLTGVGLGNFIDYVSFKYRYHGVAFDPFYALVMDTYFYPHNWFLATLAETGVVGFGSLLWLVWRMLREDRDLLNSTHRMSDRALLSVFMIPTWAYLLGNLITNLYTSLPLVVLFWFFRGMLHRIAFDRLLKP